jgi:hypothetical protein
VAQIVLDSAGIDAVVRQFVAAAMPQCVRVDLHIEARGAGRTLYHGLKAPRRKRRASPAHKHAQLSDTARELGIKIDLNYSFAQQPPARETDGTE